MKYEQVGVVAMRGPKGEFLEAQPLLREVEDNSDDSIARMTMEEVEKLFAERMKLYISAQRKLKKSKTR